MLTFCAMATTPNTLPELTEEQWAEAVQGRFYHPIKQQITARVDADVLAWLKAAGRAIKPA